ncbi:hypothetical protein [Photorhabdus cinerea]|uniref:Neamine phosphoribosyltransferase n=1 Tax=Photorhabdus cinerea TaxID=471575 RepID=A0A7X5QE77_9GAMM|nr:hypothetical protein [Photorhabdus cinerea]NHB92783.1 hypothetical protein [Photorhabdus cinerea]
MTLQLDANINQSEEVVKIQITPSVLVAGLVAAERSQQGDGYVSACALAQIWSDLSLFAEASKQSLSVCRQARLSATHAALTALSIACGQKFNTETVCTSQTDIVLQGQFAPWLDLLTRILAVPLPECYGYDLGDTEVCVDDAICFAREHLCGRPVVIVGIRSGGSFIAPRWVAGLSQVSGVTPPWLTLRPLRQINAPCQYHPSELKALFHLCDSQPKRPDIVIVDDQPDTGSTVEELVKKLAPKVESVWFASIGNVSRIKAPGSWSKVFTRSPLITREKRPLWQLLLEEDHRYFLSTLASALPNSAGTAARIFIRCPTLEKRYGQGEAWLPWNSPAMAKYVRRLINPKKTPLLVTDQNETPLLHVRFIGESVYGLAEFRRTEQFDTKHRNAWFLDGYHIAEHLPGLRPLRDLMAEATNTAYSTWLTQCNAIIELISRSPLVNVTGQLSLVPIGISISNAWRRLQCRIGENTLPDLPFWLCSLNIPPFAGSIRPIRSSLSHAFGDWHWQVDNDGHLYRFHQEANWGGVSWPELEIAAFVLVHQLSPTTLQLICNSRQEWGNEPQVIFASLPVAALLLLEGFYREVRQFSEVGKVRLCEDLARLCQTLAQYHDLIIEASKCATARRIKECI